MSNDSRREQNSFIVYFIDCPKDITLSQRIVGLLIKQNEDMEAYIVLSLLLNWIYNLTEKKTSLNLYHIKKEICSTGMNLYYMESEWTILGLQPV